MSESISSIKNKYKEISFPIMKYDEEKAALQRFIEEYCDDERSGVQSIINSANKRIASIDKEIARVTGMTGYERKYAYFLS